MQNDSFNRPEPPDIEVVDVPFEVDAKVLKQFERGLKVKVREARLLNSTPWSRSLGKLTLSVKTEGWRFPAPPLEESNSEEETPTTPTPIRPIKKSEGNDKPTRLKPPKDTVVFKDRLLYLLQPPIENLFAGKKITLPFQPFSYQMEGIAFLMPRDAALLADEMGLGKTMQTIISLRCLFHSGLIQNTLLVCPKPLVVNWTRELRLWAEDIPFEIIGGNYEARRRAWMVSNTPLKVINYELLTRDEEFLEKEGVEFDVVVIDEAQKIKNHSSKTAQVVRSIKRKRSWALTGTPIENRPEDLVNIFSFVDPDRIPPDTSIKQLASLTSDSILRRVKEEAAPDMPPRIFRDACVELSPAQRHAYDMAEKEGVVQLNKLGDTITVQHVFELVMRLKQICNFDPLTGESSKLERVLADMEEVAASQRKAIIFSQWVQPLEIIAKALKHVGPLLYHGKMPQKERQANLDQFKEDKSKHVILMSYATGSVGLNLQYCNYVFLFDRWWNPAIEDQAINRAHRLGQKEPVIVTPFVSQETIEGRIAEVLDQKRQLFNEVIAQNGPPPSMGMSQDEIFGLFAIRSRPKRAA